MTDEYDADYEPAPTTYTVLESEEPPREPGRRRARKRSRLPGCLAVLLAMAVIVAGFYVVITWGMAKIRAEFGDPADYSGPGTGRVSFEVHPGDSATAMGNNLEDAGVVASADAFVDAAGANPNSPSIQPGYYTLKKKMAAADVVKVLVNPSNIVKDTVTIPEGLRVVDTVAILAAKTKYSKADFQKVLDKPAQLQLPAYAKGNPEGYLFPATYDFGPGDKPVDMLRAMVDRWRQAADDADLEAGAKRLGYSPAEIMTVASLVQAEGRGDDMPKIARVIYNRLENPGTAGTTGKLQIDATVNYAAGNSLRAVPTSADLQIDSPYNTYLHEGLPPGPIEAPGDDAIRAALNPAEGDWYYYVTVNLKTGETKFAETPAQFAQYKNELRQYCETESAGAC